MSKPNSGYFKGTTGLKIATSAYSKYNTQNAIMKKDGLDYREHPTKYKQLSSKKLKQLREKQDKRTLTKKEYKQKEWQRRLTIRRNEAIREFWHNEKRLIKNNLPTTRNWSAEQRKAILDNKRPKFDGKPIASHHTYSVSKYPHLANRKELIFPATFYEHIYGWHGGNTRNSLPGVPIKHVKSQF